MNQVNPNCSFCGKTVIEPGKFVAGPNCFICEQCIEQASLTLLDFSEDENYRFQVNEQTSVRCDFCAKRPKEVWNLLTESGKNICSECIEICNDILGDRDEANEVNILRAAKLGKLNRNRLPPVIGHRSGLIISTQNRFLRKVLEKIF